mmetsp:Transcript_126554/g.248104  ORF Transcript_126554/g.248104 Transcript_126554/m.248104 type:complete len:227 (-) Transcript_126554:117-797(-)
MRWQSSMSARRTCWISARWHAQTLSSVIFSRPALRIRHSWAPSERQTSPAGWSSDSLRISETGATPRPPSLRALRVCGHESEPPPHEISRSMHMSATRSFWRVYLMTFPSMHNCWRRRSPPTAVEERRLGTKLISRHCRPRACGRWRTEARSAWMSVASLGAAAWALGRTIPLIPSESISLCACRQCYERPHCRSSSIRAGRPTCGNDRMRVKIRSICSWAWWKMI